MTEVRPSPMPPDCALLGFRLLVALLLAAAVFSRTTQGFAPRLADLPQARAARSGSMMCCGAAALSREVSPEALPSPGTSNVEPAPRRTFSDKPLTRASSPALVLKRAAICSRRSAEVTV